MQYRHLSKSSPDDDPLSALLRLPQSENNPCLPADRPFPAAEDWVKLDKKWREKGISYTDLLQSSGSKRERAVGFVAKIKKIVGDTITTIDFRHSVEKIKNFNELPADVQKAIKAADHIESKGFQELIGYDKGNKILWSAGGHWDGHENKPTEKFIVQNFGGMPCPHCNNKSTIQWSDK